MKRLLLSLILLVTSVAPAQNISTFAGGGPDNLPATIANVNAPYGIATDTSGNIYIAASNGNRVYKVNGAGVLTVFAGNGIAGYSGDEGNARNAMLRIPMAVAVDAAGNVFIADSGNAVVRRVDATSKIITTVAGRGGLFGYGGDGSMATGAAARLNYPDGMAFDAAGNLFVVDHSGDRIRRISAGADGMVTGASDEILSTVAGNGNFGFGGDGGPATLAALYYPDSIAFDSAGNLFIADTNNGRVRRISAGTDGVVTGASDEVITTVLYLGTNISGVAFDPTGNLFASAPNYQRIVRKYPGADGLVTGAPDETVSYPVGTAYTSGFAGDGGRADIALLYRPMGIAFDNTGRLLIADFLNNRIRRVTGGADGLVKGDADDSITTMAGNGSANWADAASAVSASLYSPSGVAMDGSGNLYITETSNARVRRVDKLTGAVTTVAGGGTTNADGIPATQVSLNSPWHSAVDSAGNVYIAEYGANRIRKVDASTGIISTLVSGVSYPFGIAVSADGSNVVFSGVYGTVQKFDVTNNALTTVANLTSYVYGLALDAAGNIFVAQYYGGYAGYVWRIDAAGTQTRVAGGGSGGDGSPAISASMTQPVAVWVDGAGNLFVVELAEHRVRRVDAGTKLISTVAGVVNTMGFKGDGGPATAAWLAYPEGVVGDSSGHLYIADRNNHRVRLVDSSNHAPVAVIEVGSTTVEATSSAGVNITIDGLSSTDADNDVLTYSWAGPFGTLTGTSISPTLALGDSLVKLTVSDGNGGSGTATVTIHVVDTTPPALTLPADYSFEATGASGATVSYSITARDLVDGDTSATCDKVSGAVFALGATPVHCTATDAHGNVAHDVFTVTVSDTSAPVMSELADIVAEATGPGGTAVTWTAVTAQDAVDGAMAANCTPASGATFALAATPVNCTATDRAGNTGSTQFKVTVHDTTPPVMADVPSNMILEATGPTGAAANWTTPTASDLVDGAVSVACTPTFGTLLPLGTTTVACAASDSHGNAVSRSFTIKVQDTIAPVVHCGTADGQWHLGDVTIVCTAADAGSGLAHAADASFALSTSVPAGTESAAAATDGRSICDVAGNCATAGPISGNMVDKKAPTIAIDTPSGGVYIVNQNAVAAYSCIDSGSGVASCAGTAPNGSAIDTTSVGQKSFAVNATDKVGNVAPPQNVTYQVAYNICLLYDPTKAVKSGSTIPLKLQLCDANRNDVSSLATAVHATRLMLSSSNATYDLVDSGNANPDADFRFDPSLGVTGGYVFNLSTKGLPTGTYLLNIGTGGDPTSHTLQFQVR